MSRFHDGWLILPGDLDFPLGWKPETGLSIVASEGDVGSHILVGAEGSVRVILAGEHWPPRLVNRSWNGLNVRRPARKATMRHLFLSRDEAAGGLCSGSPPDELI